jgi:hypothetical protein
MTGIEPTAPPGPECEHQVQRVKVQTRFRISFGRTTMVLNLLMLDDKNVETYPWLMYETGIAGGRLSGQQALLSCAAC